VSSWRARSARRGPTGRRALAWFMLGVVAMRRPCLCPQLELSSNDKPLVAFERLSSTSRAATTPGSAASLPSSIDQRCVFDLRAGALRENGLARDAPACSAREPDSLATAHGLVGIVDCHGVRASQIRERPAVANAWRCASAARGHRSHSTSATALVDSRAALIGDEWPCTLPAFDSMFASGICAPTPFAKADRP
jgi:hypothetical protein